MNNEIGLALTGLELQCNDTDYVMERLFNLTKMEEKILIDIINNYETPNTYKPLLYGFKDYRLERYNCALEEVLKFRKENDYWNKVLDKCN